MLRGFFHTTVCKEETEPMRGWFLFAIIGFLVFGIPLIDELYRLRVRRDGNRARPTVHEPITLVPDGDERDFPGSGDVAPVARTREHVA
jgi:hypothetical protein